METILTNRRFIRGANVLLVVLSLFIIMLFVNEVKASKYIGHGSGQAATITVTGIGDVTAVSDIASLSFTVEKDASTTKEAQNLLNESLTKTLEYLKGQNIEDKDIKSEYGGVNPKYSNNQIYCVRYPCPQPDQKITGYTASQSITVKVRAVDSANDIRTGLATLGITNISGPTFSIDDQDALNAAARSKAIEDAQSKAKALAKDLHVRLGDIVSFSENGSGAYPMMYAKSSMDMAVGSAAAPAPELPKGENKITSTVNIVYEIR